MKIINLSPPNWNTRTMYMCDIHDHKKKYYLWCVNFIPIYLKILKFLYVPFYNSLTVVYINYNIIYYYKLQSIKLG